HTSWPRDWSSDVCSSDLLRDRRLVAQPTDGREGVVVEQHQIITRRGFQARVVACREADILLVENQFYMRAPGRVGLQVVRGAVRSEERRVGKEGGAVGVG